MAEEQDDTKFYISEGGVQCYIARSTPFTMIHYGRVEYDRDKPILTESLRRQGQEICDKLNAGEMTLNTAKVLLSKIWY